MRGRITQAGVAPGGHRQLRCDITWGSLEPDPVIPESAGVRLKDGRTRDRWAGEYNATDLREQSLTTSCR